MYDVAVVMPTIIIPQIDRAIHSVFNQDFDGKIQMLVGLDYPCGNKENLWSLQIQAPKHVQLDVLHLGYSTRKDKGGLYYNWGGGALRTILTFAANARYVAYLDDDCWYDHNHISSLMDLITKKKCDWVYSERRAIDLETGEAFSEEAIDWMPGPDTNCFLIDKIRCHKAIHGWARVEEPSKPVKGESGKFDVSYHDEADFMRAHRKSGDVRHRGVPSNMITVNYGLNPKSPVYRHNLRKATQR